MVDSQLAGWLVVEPGTAQEQMYQLRDALRIGRTDDNDIVLADPKISSNHAVVQQSGGGFDLRDLGSTNGTFVNETQLVQPQELRDGDTIRMGNTRLVFRWMPASTVSQPPRVQAPEATMVAPLSPPRAATPQHTPPQPMAAPPYIPPQPVAAKPPSRFPAGLWVLVAGLLLVACAIAAVVAYLALGKPDIGKLSLGADEATAEIVTVVVTSGPEAIATVVVTSEPEALPTLVVTSEPAAVATQPSQPATATETPVVAPTAIAPVATEVSGPQEMISFHSNRDGNWEIYVMRPDGSDVRRLSDDPALDAALKWSPDGQRATFTSDRTGNRDILTMNADGSGLTNISNDPEWDSDSAWSPDGGRIAFESGRGGDWEIWVMGADGSNAVNLTNAVGGDGKPVWSPDGAKIAFESARDGNVEIYVMNADGSNQINLTNNPAADQLPAWSPDGTQIAFHTDRDGNVEVYAMNPDGSNLMNLTNNPATDKQAIWSPDGGRIAFNSDRGGTSAIHIMQRDGSNVIAVGGEGNNWPTDWSMVDLPTAAQPVPTQAPPQGFSLPFNDDFSDPGSGFQVDSTAETIKEYKDGEYIINILVDDWMSWSYVPDATVGDFSAEVDVRQIGNVEDGAWGLLFRYVDSDNWYRLRISPKGMFEVKKKLDGSYIPIQEWTSSVAILTGQATNRLSVTCKGDQIAISVNNQHLTTVRDQAFQEGSIALVAQAFQDKPNVNVAFDNLSVIPATDVPPPLLGPLPWTDDFSDANSGWLADDNDSAEYGYRNGEYLLRVKNANQLFRVPLPEKTYADLNLEVDATMVDGPDTGYYGVIFRFLDHDNQYLFRVAADGRIRLDKKAAGEYVSLVPWQESPAVHTGQATNHLQVVCQGPQCSLYVNDQLIATIDDNTFLQGRIGFVAGNPTDIGGTAVHYDNLRISTP